MRNGPATFCPRAYPLNPRFQKGHTCTRLIRTRNSDLFLLHSRLSAIRALGTVVAAKQISRGALRQKRTSAFRPSAQQVSESPVERTMRSCIRASMNQSRDKGASANRYAPMIQRERSCQCGQCRVCEKLAAQERIRGAIRLWAKLQPRAQRVTPKSFVDTETITYLVSRGSRWRAAWIKREASRRGVTVAGIYRWLYRNVPAWSIRIRPRHEFLASKS